MPNWSLETLKIPKSNNLLSDGIKTIVFYEAEHTIDSIGNVIYERINFNKNVPEQICEVLYNFKIQSVIIEGGCKTIQSFIDKNIWDEARVFSNTIKFKNGIECKNFPAGIP